MSSRHFPDFINAYLDYAKNAISPDMFQFWTGISIIAGALERKVWVEQDGYILHPNLYVMLVGKPASGKTSAGNRGIRLLRKLGDGDKRKQVKFIADEMSQASLVDQMKASYKTYVTDKGERGHSSAFFYASEASKSLNEINGGGDLITTLLALYDCNEEHLKSLRTEDVVVKYPCLNMLACSTFAFLEQLLPSAVVGNGFASRITYVVHDEIIIRRPKWHPVAGDKSARTAQQEKLLHDLSAIYELKGAFQTTPAYEEAWENFYPENDAQVQAMKSEKLQEFVGRRITNLTKLSMVCAASESNDLILDIRHWDRAKGLIADIEVKLNSIMKNSAPSNDSKGMTYHVLRTIQDAGGFMMKDDLVPALIRKNLDAIRLEHLLKTLHSTDRVESFLKDSKQGYRLACDPNDYL